MILKFHIADFQIIINRRYAKKIDKLMIPSKCGIIKGQIGESGHISCLIPKKGTSLFHRR